MLDQQTRHLLSADFKTSFRGRSQREEHDAPEEPRSECIEDPSPLSHSEEEGEEGGHTKMSASDTELSPTIPPRPKRGRLWLLVAVCGGVAVMVMLTPWFGWVERMVASDPTKSTALILVLTGVLLVVFILYHLFFAPRSARRIRLAALAMADELFHLNKQLDGVIASFEEQMVVKMRKFPAAKMRAFGSLKRINCAIAHRLEEVEPLLSSWRLADVHAGHDLLQKSLILSESAFDWVIGSSEVPPLDAESLQREVDQLLATLAE